MTDPYKVLGLSEDASKEVLQAKYDELKARYSEQRFLDGEEGNEGARLLHELETAWALIRRDFDERGKQDMSASYDNVDKLVKAGDLNGAQNILDRMVNRDAKWHYFQAMVFYKKEWLSESRAQLALAVSMEPGNTKYKDALAKIDMVMGNSTINAKTMGNEQNRGPYQNNQGYNQSQQSNNYQENYQGNSLSRCCATYCMLESCCTLMRCCM